MLPAYWGLRITARPNLAARVWCGFIAGPKKHLGLESALEIVQTTAILG